MSADTSPSRFVVSLQPVLEEVYEPDYAPELPLVHFDAYGTGERLFGWVRLRADRLTDLLNAHAELVLTDVERQSLDDGTTQSADEVIVGCAELVAVHASGPRGDRARRRPTQSHPVLCQAGEYLIGGHLHVEPGDDPIASLAQRPPMVPLTDAWIEFKSGHHRSRQRAETLIVNRHLLDWIFAVSDEALLRVP